MDHDIPCCLLLFLSSGVRVLPNKFAMYLLQCKKGTTQQLFVMHQSVPSTHVPIREKWTDLSGYTVRSNSKCVP